MAQVAAVEQVQYLAQELPHAMSAAKKKKKKKAKKLPQNPATNEVRFIISGIRSQIFQYAKNQEDTIHNEKTNQSIKIT